MNAVPSFAGIETYTDGQRVIPASVRADGTVRPARRVRDGFVPKEDLQRYRAPPCRQESASPPPSLPLVLGRLPEQPRCVGSQGVVGYFPTAETGVAVSSTAAKKKKKKKKTQQDEQREEEVLVEDLQGLSIDPTSTTPQPAEDWVHVGVESPMSQQWEMVEPVVDREKRLRALRKKLRQMEEIRAKKESGDVLTEEQELKLKRLQEVREELEQMEKSSSSSSSS